LERTNRDNENVSDRRKYNRERERERERVKKTARLKEHRYRQSQKQQVEIWTDKHVGRKTDGENDTNSRDSWKE